MRHRLAHITSLFTLQRLLRNPSLSLCPNVFALSAQSTKREGRVPATSTLFSAIKKQTNKVELPLHLHRRAKSVRRSGAEVPARLPTQAKATYSYRDGVVNYAIKASVSDKRTLSRSVSAGAIQQSEYQYLSQWQ